LEREFLGLHESLKLDASERAARAVIALANRGPSAREPVHRPALPTAGKSV
jgi:hypothetical protein